MQTKSFKTVMCLLEDWATILQFQWFVTDQCGAMACVRVTQFLKLLTQCVGQNTVENGELTSHFLD